MKSPRTPLRKVSEKRLAANGGQPMFSSISKRSAIRKKPRKPREFKRVYGSKQRVEWVSWQPCVACECTGPVPRQNAHIETGGMGRKASYTKIVPMCAFAHAEFHQHGRQRFEREFGIDLAVEAARIQAEWLRYLEMGDAA